jgi:ABC-2 type transport system ATP-binding protein
VYNLERSRRKRRLAEVSERYDLARLQRQRAGTLSGGQKQRLALACAMLHEPELLFLDEPTSAVDPENRRAFWESLFDLVEERTTILVSTHYMDEAERCHALAILDRGHLVAEGPPAQLSRDIDAQVVVIETDQPRQAGRLLHQQGWVRSVAQIGNELRVLIRRDLPDAAEEVRREIAGSGGAVSRCELDRASLEDVFVAATLQRRESEAA